ncbi:MAG: peptidase S8 [Bacteroidetes bacterium]|nr:peptidase S8 [Bacteroidota bacterium]
MKRKSFKLAVLILFTGLCHLSQAQAIPGTLNWYNGEGVGMFTNKAYKKLKKKKSNEVIVAVIDSGVDIEHEDLKGKIWVNAKEIPNNKVDDDKNGYVDDVHGWNFLGNSKGENINEARLEKARILAKLTPKYEGISPEEIISDAEYELYLEVLAAVESDRSNFEPYMEMLNKKLLDPETAKYINDQMNFNLNPNYDDRSLLGDNPEDFNDRNYGNPDVEGPDALHGTHVAGIIAANRTNNLGVEGVAENVKIMSIRTVPNGDEHDKDVALAIRYAVDNGAKVINMSFGKAYSPKAQWVYEAMAYADSRGVLLVHAAGNDSKDIDVEPNFPTEKYDFQTTELVHILTVGASTRNDSEALVAGFSNFGSYQVDVFAPGFEIYNTVPQSEYMNLQGTSMAAPMVAGMAAMLASYYPTLTMAEIREAILRTVVLKKPLTDLCNTGGIVNILKAVKYCTKLEKSKK